MTITYRWLQLALLAALVGQSNVTLAQSAPTEAKPPAEDSTTTTETTPDKAKPAPPGKPAPEIFVPTEEISEDFAVSFPVDI